MRKASGSQMGVHVPLGVLWSTAEGLNSESSTIKNQQNGQVVEIHTQKHQNVFSFRRNIF